MSEKQRTGHASTYKMESIPKTKLGFDKLKREIMKKYKGDVAHDFEHILRVIKNAQKIAKKENGNSRLIMVAALLHDLVSYPKSDPRSKNSSVESARKARAILKRYSFKNKEIEIIADSIRDHSYSRGMIPQTLEGKILQDADRLDAMGAIGIARVFSVGGSEGRPFYNEKDPFCKKHIPDDKIWTLDHFYKKLLHLEKTMNTRTAKIEARKRIKIMKEFLYQLKKEI